MAAVAYGQRAAGVRIVLGIGERACPVAALTTDRAAGRRSGTTNNRLTQGDCSLRGELPSCYTRDE